MSNAISSHGTLIYRNGTVIGEQRDITPAPHTRNTYDTSNQNDGDASFIVGMRQKGDLTFQINLLPSGDASHGTAAGLRGAWVSGAKDLYKVVYPDTSFEMYSGYLTNFAPTAPVDGALTAQITIKPTNATIFGNT